MANDVWNASYFGAAVNTLKASRWEVWKARWFGRRTEAEDGGHIVVGYHYRGKFYMTDYRTPR